MSVRRLMLVSLVPGVLGCADDVVVSDASPDAPADAMIDVSLVIPPVTPPALPEPVDGGPCPSGWETMDLGRATVCRPWDDDGPGCADGEVRFPGDDGCQVLGESSCSAGGFPTDVTGPVIYVEAGATSGDGSMDTPFGTIGEAVVVATSGDTVAIAGGTYAEEVTLPDGVSLRGACASTTIIEGADGPLSSAVVTAGEGSAVSDLTLRGGRPGLRIDGVAASAARLRVEATHLGIPVINGGSLDAEEIAVVGTDGEPGAGLFLLNAARATVDRAFLEDNLSFGVGVGGEDSELVLRRAVIRRTRIAEGATLGVGIAVNGPATVTVEQSELSENRAGGFTAQDRAIATIRSTVIRDTAPAPDGLLGSGIIGSMGATITVEGSLLVRNTSAAVSLIGLQTALLARDVVFADTRSNGSGETTEAGVGIIIGDGSTADLRRAVVDGAAGLGISVSGLDSRLDARDLVVRNVAPRPVDLAAGRGIDVEREASAGLERLVVEDVRGSAILVVDLGSALALTDATLRRVLSDARTRASGRGLTLQFAGDFEATRLQIEETRDVGILAYGEDVYVRATDLAIDRTLPRECAVDTCADFRSGNGITASDGAQVEIESFRIADSTLVGLQLARGARIVASDGLVTRNAVGVNAQTEGFDPADVSRNVQFVDNGINFDGSALPIPQPGSR